MPAPLAHALHLGRIAWQQVRSLFTPRTQQQEQGAAGAHEWTRKLEPPRARRTSASSKPATIRAPHACARPQVSTADDCQDETRRPSQTKPSSRRSGEQGAQVTVPAGTRCTARVGGLAAQVQRQYYQPICPSAAAECSNAERESSPSSAARGYSSLVCMSQCVAVSRAGA